MIRFPQPWAYNQTPPDVHPKIKPRYHIHICVPCYNEPSDIVFATCALLTLTRTRTRTRTRTPLPTPNPPNPHTQPNPNPNPNTLTRCEAALALRHPWAKTTVYMLDDGESTRAEP